MREGEENEVQYMYLYLHNITYPKVTIFSGYLI